MISRKSELDRDEAKCWDLVKSIDARIAALDTEREALVADRKRLERAALALADVQPDITPLQNKKAATGS